MTTRYTAAYGWAHEHGLVAWIRRSNAIAELPAVERQARVDACAARGYHEPCGETFATATPIHVCADCLSEFSESELT